VVNNSLENVVVYPNPTNNELTIQYADKGTVIKLFNILGQQVYCGTVDKITQTINTNELPAGAYLLQLTDKDGNRMNRTILKK
jgi:hypothetical protein